MNRSRPALLFLAAVLAAPAHAPGGDALFEGKPLAHWVKLLREDSPDPSKASPEWRKAPWVLRRAGEPALPALIAALEDPSARIRRRSLSGLLGMGPKAAPAVPRLSETLKDADLDIRHVSAIVLGQIGPGARAAVPALAQALKDTDPRIRVAAATSLGEIGALEAVPALEEAAKDPVPAVQVAARGALAALRGERKQPR